MEPRHLIRAAIAVSVVGHLALAAGVFFADARPIEMAATDNVAVDLVTPQELAEAEKKAEEAPPEPEKTPEQKPEPEKPEFRLPDLTTKPTFEEQKVAATPPSQAQSARQQSQAAPPPQQPAAQQAQQQQAAPAQSPRPSSAAQPPAQQQAALQPSQPPPQAPPSSEPPPVDAVPPQPDPDITVKYGVMLGLPGFGGGTATEQADIPKSDIAAFRNHLRSCLKRPANIALNDDVMVKLRATLSRDGRLTAEPSVIEVRRPAKAVLLLQAAKQALEACQPYSMLPADKYDEWKVLDLPFTPQDFAG